MERAAAPLSVVRQKALAKLRAIGAGDGDGCETILIKDRLFVGRRFCLGGFEAVWLAGEGDVSIFNEVGELIDTQPLEEDVGPRKKAA